MGERAIENQGLFRQLVMILENWCVLVIQRLKKRKAVFCQKGKELKDMSFIIMIVPITEMTQQQSSQRQETSIFVSQRVRISGQDFLIYIIHQIQYLQKHLLRKQKNIRKEWSHCTKKCSCSIFMYRPMQRKYATSAAHGSREQGKTAPPYSIAYR